MRTIYWAAPLHNKVDQERNDKYVKLLRDAGHKVYVPQEHGVWEDMLKNGASRQEVRRYLFELDMNAMRKCDTCIACCGDAEVPRAPSEGMLWEMGWMSASHKSVFLFNENNYWDFNLMPEFGSTRMFSNFDDLLNYLEREEPV